MNAGNLLWLEEKFRPLFDKLSLRLKTKIYSAGRKKFLEIMKDEKIDFRVVSPKNLERILWGIKFPSPIMNAAGMFKNGECYELMARQGAGGYLGGTSTFESIIGNEKNGIKTPFVKLSKSGAALNWLGLPNDGIGFWKNDFQKYELEIKISEMVKVKKMYGCPVGWSVAINGENVYGLGTAGILLRVLKNAGVDFIEINRSCPNTKRDEAEMSYVLGNIMKESYVKMENGKSKKIVPLIVKFSNDAKIKQVPKLIDTLIEFKFDGVNFGNTSTGHSLHRNSINENEKKLFDYFTSEFGGGISGIPLKKNSLKLCEAATEYVQKIKLNSEFHVIRTGGIENAQDLIDSNNAGVSLNQWFTGYWENFRKYENKVYEKIYGDLTNSRDSR